MKLPTGWAATTLRKLGGTVGGKTPSKAVSGYWTGGTIPWVSPKDMKIFKIAGSEDKITHQALIGGAMNLLPADSVLMVTRSGILAHTFPVAITGCAVTINQDIKAVRPSSAFNSKWLAYSLRAQSATILGECTKAGTTVASVEMEALESLPIPMPPLPEQTRIADRLDTALTRVDACRDRLARVAPLLKRFRQSVLAAATSGRLTEDWHKAVAASDWRESTVSEVCESGRVITYGVVKLGDEIDNGIPCLRTSNVRWLSYELDGLKRISSSISADYARTILRGGEVLVNVRGTLGGVAVATDTMAGWNISREVAVIPVDKRRVQPKYLAFVVASESSQRWLAKVEKGVAYVGINIEDLRNLPLSIPNISEQTEIVRRVETLFAFADRLEARLKTAQIAVDRLTPALLAKAFRGELVPQDPNDEPAAELLKRLATSRDAAPKAKRGRRSATADTTP